MKYNVFGGTALSASMGYVGTLMGKLFGVDLKTGAIAWTFEGEGFKNNGQKYFNAESRHPDAVLSKFGNFSEVLKMYGELGAIFSTPAVTNDNIVFTASDGWVYCLGR